MATTTKIIFKADTVGGQKTYSFNYVKPGSSTANIQALGQALVTNGSIYKYPPLQIASIELQTTTTTAISPT